MARKASELTPKERLQVIEMAAARYSIKEIASQMDLRESSTMTIINSAKETIDARRKEIDAAHAEMGLRSRERRINELEALFKKVMSEQLESTITTETRITSKGLKIEVPVFNAPAIREARAILDDIAKETAGRQLAITMGGDDKNGPIRVEAINYAAAVAPILSDKEPRKSKDDDTELTDEEMDAIIGGD